MAVDARRLLVAEDEPLLNSLVVLALQGAGFEVESAHDVMSARARIDSFDPGDWVNVSGISSGVYHPDPLRG